MDGWVGAGGGPLDTDHPVIQRELWDIQTNPGPWDMQPYAAAPSGRRMPVKGHRVNL